MRFEHKGTGSSVEKELSREIQIETAQYEAKDYTKSFPKQMEDAGYVDASRGNACVYDGMGSGAAAEYAAQAALRGTQACTQNPTEYPGLSSETTQTTTRDTLLIEATRFIKDVNKIVWNEKSLPVVKERAVELVRIENPHLLESGRQFSRLVNECIYSNQTTIAFTKIFQDPDRRTWAMSVNVGDSRTYLRRNGSWTQLSKDHSYSEPLLKEGLIKNEVDHEQLVYKADIEKTLKNSSDPAMRMALTQLLQLYHENNSTELPLGDFNSIVYESLGYDETDINPNISFIELQDGDELYLMTDYLYENLPLENFETVRKPIKDEDFTTVCHALYKAAKIFNRKPDDCFIIAQRVKI